VQSRSKWNLSPTAYGTDRNEFGNNVQLHQIVLTDFSSASDVAATTKSETLSSGWRQLVYRAEPTSSRSELENTPSREWA